MRSGLERRMELPHKGRIRHCRGEQLQDSTQPSSGWGHRQIDSPGTPGKPKSQTKNRHVPNSSFISLTLGKEQWLGEQRGGAAREGATEEEPHGVVPRACVSIALSRSS